MVHALLLLLGCPSAPPGAVDDPTSPTTPPAPTPPECTVRPWFADDDGDGFGAGSAVEACEAPSGHVPTDGDCDDEDPRVWPGADVVLADGVDQDCDGLDEIGLRDDFEDAARDPTVWASWTGASRTTEVRLHGAAGLWFGPGPAEAETQPMDTSACTEVVVELSWIDGPYDFALDALFLVEWRTGADWTVAGALRAPSWLHPEPWHDERLVIDDTAALGPGLQVRIRTADPSAEGATFVVDDVAVGCPGLDDVDGDGQLGLWDCDDGDPLHHSDCATCVDSDGDGFGADCDPGPDCDDGDPAVHPGAAESLDGRDTDCDGLDAIVWRDDFEARAPDPTLWGPLDQIGDPYVVADAWVSGAHSLSMADAQLTTVGPLPLDCPAVDLAVQARPLTSSGEIGWRVEGGAPDPTHTSAGALPDFASGATSVLLEQARVEGSVTLDADGLWWVDDVQIACSSDDDGDRRGELADCDPVDPAHHHDCGLCVDSDGDGFGADCDWGPDPDDADATAYPGAADVPLLDDFEGLTPDPAVWREWIGEVRMDLVESFSGSSALELDGSLGVLESHGLDAASCTAISWAFATWEPARRERTLSLELGNPGDWRGVQSTVLSHVDGWRVLAGRTTDPTHLRDGVQLRLQLEPEVWTTTMTIDAFAVGCEVDGDGDGVLDAADCAPADPDHWFDCGRCVDDDGDQHGVDCDLGVDCDESDVDVHAGALDLLVDGVDDDCDALDGPPLLREDFEDGFDPIWASTAGVFRTPGVGWLHSYAARVGHGGLVSGPLDATACATVEAQWWVGAGWIDYEQALSGELFDAASGTAAMERIYVPGAGHVALTDVGPPLAGSSELHFRLVVTGGFTELDVDEVAVGCAMP